MLTFAVDPWVVPHLLAWVDMDPPPLVLAVHLNPNMVLAVPHPPHSYSRGSAQHTKTIGEFSCSTSLRLQQYPYIRITWEALVCSAAYVTAPVQLDPVAAPGLLIRCGRGHTLSYGGSATYGTSRVVDKGEEGALEPSRTLLGSYHEQKVFRHLPQQ